MISNDPLGLLSSEQQRQTIADLERHAKLCILTSPVLLGYYDRSQLATRPPLLQYVEKNFTEVESNGPFHVLQRNGADQEASGLLPIYDGAPLSRLPQQ